MDLHRVAQIIKGTGPAGPPKTLRLRQGTVATVNPDGTIDITLGGDDTVIPSVVCCKDVSPTAGDSIWLLSDGVDLLGIGVT